MTGSPSSSAGLASSSSLTPTKVLLLYVVVVGAARLLLAWPAAARSGLVVPLLLVWPPCLLALTNRVPIENLGLGNPFARPSVVATLVGCLVVGIYALFYLFVVSRWLPYGASALPELAVGLLIMQWLSVALPEEFFFRGFLQGCLAEQWRDWHAIVLSALLFALAHVVLTGHLRSLEVFFPGLLFGWLRARSGSIWIPAVFHGGCNVLHWWLLALL